jgi:hypothetical protein
VRICAFDIAYQHPLVFKRVPALTGKYLFDASRRMLNSAFHWNASSAFLIIALGGVTAQYRRPIGQTAGLL